MPKRIGKCARVLLLGLALLVSASNVWAADGNYNGKIDTLQVTTLGMRFFVKAQSLNLYAGSDVKTVLVEGFFQKATFTIVYTPIPCGKGVTGKCGTVTSAIVQQTGF